MPCLLSVPAFLSLGRRSSSTPSPVRRSPAQSLETPGRVEGHTLQVNVESTLTNICRVPPSPLSATSAKSAPYAITPSTPALSPSLAASGQHAVSGTVVAAKGLRPGTPAEKTPEKLQNRLDRAMASTEQLGKTHSPRRRTGSRIANGLAATEKLEVRRYRSEPADPEDFIRRWTK